MNPCVSAPRLLACKSNASWAHREPRTLVGSLNPSESQSHISLNFESEVSLKVKEGLPRGSIVVVITRGKPGEGINLSLEGLCVRVK